MNRTHYEQGLVAFVVAALGAVYWQPRVVEIAVKKAVSGRRYQIVFGDPPLYATKTIAVTAASNDAAALAVQLANAITADSQLPTVERQNDVLILRGRYARPFTVEAGVTSGVSPYPYDATVDGLVPRRVVEYTPLTVVLANEGAPRAGEPYVALQVIESTPQGRIEDTTEEEDDTIIERALIRYDGVCDVNTYGPDHRQMMEAIRTAAGLTDPRTAAQALGVVVRGMGPSMAVPELDTTVWRGRTRAELQFSFALRSEAEIDPIEQAMGTVDLED